MFCMFCVFCLRKDFVCLFLLDLMVCLLLVLILCSFVSVCLMMLGVVLM